ncbi:TolC family protein [Sulfurimonas sp. HSL-1716]|uniref:TolC family protein n=1 Tax=Hydrocurvibacter sulfurireducens TaxID=3131937 RepID=UPI0031F82C04
MKKIVGVLSAAMILYANGINYSDSPSLEQAIEMVKSDNLEVKAARFDEQIATEDADIANSYNYGSLNFMQDVARSNDAGNVFGFKLTSREATFGDFGAQEFMTNFMAGHPDYVTPPHDLNYPEDRSFFQSKLKYEVAIFTGFKLSSYQNISEAMKKMKTLDKDKLLNEKIYQIRKSYYDMALLKYTVENLNIILNNINTLEDMTKNMIKEGYAKNVDLLEVQAKKGNVTRLVNQMTSNEKLLYHYLSFLLNRDITSIKTPDQDIKMPSINNDDIIANNLDIKRATTGLEIRKNMVSAEQSAYYPTIGAFAEMSTADDTFLGDADKHKAYTVGARLTWNIFNGGKDSASVQKARIERLKTQTQVELAKKGILLQVAKIKTQIQSYDDDIASLKQELKLADQIYKNYEARYREQLASMSDVIIKQSQQIEKILKLQEARNKRNERIFALENISNGDR